MPNAPLTPEGLAEIERVIEIMRESGKEIAWALNLGPSRFVEVSLMGQLLADAKFWREAVRSARVIRCPADCPFCIVMDFNHKPDCPWLLAQR